MIISKKVQQLNFVCNIYYFINREEFSLLITHYIYGIPRDSGLLKTQRKKTSFLIQYRFRLFPSIIILN